MATENRKATPEETKALFGKGLIMPVPRPASSSTAILQELMQPKTPSTELQEKQRRLLKILQEEALSKPPTSADAESKP